MFQGEVPKMPAQPSALLLHPTVTVRKAKAKRHKIPMGQSGKYGSSKEKAERREGAGVAGKAGGSQPACHAVRELSHPPPVQQLGRTEKLPGEEGSKIKSWSRHFVRVECPPCSRCQSPQGRQETYSFTMPLPIKWRENFLEDSSPCW